MPPRSTAGRNQTPWLIEVWGVVRVTSGAVDTLDYKPLRAELERGRITLGGFESGGAGDLYVSARLYFKDGSAASDARLTSVLSSNPVQLSILPRVWAGYGHPG